MAKTTAAQRRDAAVERAEKCEARVKEYRAREASYRLKGKVDKADEAGAIAARQQRLAHQHRQEVERLDLRARREAGEILVKAARAHRMAKAQESADQSRVTQPPVDPLVAYMEVLQHASELEVEIAQKERSASAHKRAGRTGQAEIAMRGAEQRRGWLADWRAEAERIQSETPRDLPKEMKALMVQRRKAESAIKNESKRLDHLGVVSDLRTAAGQREIATGGKGRGEAIASLRDYSSLIRRPQDRTAKRLEAMREFDGLCALAEEGLFPEMKLERESTSGAGPGQAIMATRAAGLQDMQELREIVGGRNVDMLRAWIYERQTLTSIVRAGFGTEKTAGALALAAVDSLVVWFRTRNALAARLAGNGVRPPVRPSPPVLADQEVTPLPRPEHETANSEYRRAHPGQSRILRFWSAPPTVDDTPQP